MAVPCRRMPRLGSDVDALEINGLIRAWTYIAVPHVYVYDRRQTPKYVPNNNKVQYYWTLVLLVLVVGCDASPVANRFTHGRSLVLVLTMRICVRLDADINSSPLFPILVVPLPARSLVYSYSTCMHSTLLAVLLDLLNRAWGPVPPSITSSFSKADDCLTFLRGAGGHSFAPLAQRSPATPNKDQ